MSHDTASAHARSDPQPDANAEQLFLAAHEALDRITAAIGRRYVINHEDREDLFSEVTIKIMDHEYAVLRKFRGDSSLEGYLRMVVNNHFRDWRNRRWGKWRHSAKARMLGAAALKLECLISRDGLSGTEAVETVLARTDVTESREQLEEIAEQLPLRQRRARIEGGEDAEIHVQQAAGNENPEQRLIDAELGEIQDDVRGALQEALTELDDEDRLILQLKFFEGVKVVHMAKMLGLEQKKLYPRIKAIERSIGRKLADTGITADAVRQLTEWTDIDLGIDQFD